jgi:hypothetical protein
LKRRQFITALGSMLLARGGDEDRGELRRIAAELKGE